MNRVGDVFDKFGGTTALARAIDVNVSAASEMRRRSSIPVVYWQKIMAAAKQRGLTGFTYEKLVAIHTPGSKRERASA